MVLRLSVVAALAMSFVVPALAQDKGVTCAGPQDACQQNVDVWQNFSAAWNKHDAAGTAALFTGDAVWQLPGMAHYGRPAIEKALSDHFKTGASNEVAKVDE